MNSEADPSAIRSHFINNHPSKGAHKEPSQALELAATITGAGLVVEEQPEVRGDQHEHVLRALGTANVAIGC